MGLSIDDVAGQSRIGVGFLEAIEAAKYELLPTPVQTRGFIRKYAKIVGLDAEELLRELPESQSSVGVNGVLDSMGKGSIASKSTLESSPFFNPVNVDLSGRVAGTASLHHLIVIVTAVLIALLLIVSRFVAIPAMARDAGATPESDALMSDAPASADGVIPGEAITSTSRSDRSAAVDTVTERPTLPAVLDELRLRLDITERSWLQVTVDDVTVFQGLAKKDDVFEWEAQRDARLLTGNAIGIFVTVNDVELGKLGSRNEVADVTWTTVSN